MVGILDPTFHPWQLYGIDLSALPPVPVSAADMANNPATRAAMRAQANPGTALEGELGVWWNPHGGFSTELSQTVADPRLNHNAPTNIPMLVLGQDQQAIQRILAGRATEQDQETAINRAVQRVQAGAPLPGYMTFQQAIDAASRRSREKQGPWR